MSELCTTAAVAATRSTLTDESDESTALSGDSWRESWFSEAVQELLPNDVGLSLHVLTEVPQSTCYRYASGGSQPTLYCYRKLLFTPQGETWLNVLMDGCKQPWWIRKQDIEKRLATLEQKAAAILEMLQ